jgi:predicted aspartyl protease
LTSVEYRRRPDGLYLAAVQIEFQEGKRLAYSGVLVDTGATKCMVPKETNEQVFHFEKVGCDDKVDTGLGPATYDWIVIPKMTLMARRLAREGETSVTYGLKETDLSQVNVEAWLGDDYVLGMNFIGQFDVRMTRDSRIIFEG